MWFIFSLFLLFNSIVIAQNEVTNTFEGELVTRTLYRLNTYTSKIYSRDYFESVSDGILASALQELEAAGGDKQLFLTVLNAKIMEYCTGILANYGYQYALGKQIDYKQIGIVAGVTAGIVGSAIGLLYLVHKKVEIPSYESQCKNLQKT